MTDPLVLAYLAGIVDADGYIGIQRRMPSKANRMSSPKYSGRLSVGMVDPEAIDLFAETWPGLKTGLRRRRAVPRLSEVVGKVLLADGRPIRQLDVEQRRAFEIVDALLPFLRVKRRSAEAVLQLQELQAESRQHRTKVMSVRRFVGGPNAGHEYRVFGLSDGYLGRCDALYQMCKELRA